MQQKKPMNMMVFILLLVGVFVAYILFTGMFRGCQNNKPELPKMSAEKLEPYKQDLVQNGKEPAAYISGLFDDHDAVFLGNMLFLEALQPKQQVDLVVKLVPEIYKKGVTVVGILNLLAKDQKKIDAVVTAADFDEKQVKQLLFNRFVLGGYEEYVNLLRVVWSVNKKRSAHERPMRILGLSPEIHFEHMHEEKGLKDPQDSVVYKKIYGDLIIDDFMLDIIKKQVIETKTKALLFLPQAYCIIRAKSPAMVTRYKKLGFDYSGSTAYQLQKLIGDRCASVFLHSPWWLNNDGRLSIEYPVDGIFDNLLRAVSSEYKQKGIGVTAGAFADVQIKKPYWLSRHFFLDPGDGLYLKDLCDGYVLLGPLSLYQDVTPIPNFITEANFQEAVDKSPWPNPESDGKGEKLTPEKMNQFLNVYSEFFNNLIGLFRVE